MKENAIKRNKTKIVYDDLHKELEEVLLQLAGLLKKALEIEMKIKSSALGIKKDRS